MSIYPSPIFQDVTVKGSISALNIVETLITIAALRVNTASPSAVNVLNYATSGDNGGGTFWLNTADTTSHDNGGTIIVDASENRWYRQVTTHITVAMFGAAGDGATDDTMAIQAALNSTPANGIVLVPMRQYLINSATLVIPQGVTLQGPWAGMGIPGPTNYDYSAVLGSLILNPSFTIQLSRESGINGLVIRCKGLVAATSPAHMMSNQLGKTGTAVTIGTGSADSADDCRIHDMLILGLAQAIATNGNARFQISRVKFDCSNGILIENCLDWSNVMDCEGWPFLVVNGNPAFNSAYAIVSSTSVTGGVRSFTTTTAHGYSTGWPVIITTQCGVPEAVGIWLITVTSPTSFTLATPLNLDTGFPIGIGAATSSGGYVVASCGIVNHGTAYQCANSYDWGNFTRCRSYGFAIGHLISGSNNTTLLNCGADNFFAPITSGVSTVNGYYGAIGFSIVDTSDSANLIGSQASAQTVGFSIDISGGPQDNVAMMNGCSSWGIGTKHIHVLSGSLMASNGKTVFDGSVAGAEVLIGSGAGIVSFSNYSFNQTFINNQSAVSNNLRIIGGDQPVWTETSEPALTAGGTNQATATELGAYLCDVTTCPSGAGVRLPPSPTTISIQVFNSAANAVLIYPQSGAQIGANGANIPFTLAPSAATLLSLVSANQWQKLV